MTLSPYEASKLGHQLESIWRKVQNAPQPMQRILAIGFEVMLRAAVEYGWRYEATAGGVTWREAGK
jgi:hypothetical protein